MRKFVNRIINKLQKTFPPNRIVALLTPLVFAPVAGFTTAWIAQHFPGMPTFTPDQMTGFFVSGAGAAVAAGYKWIDGWQKNEQILSNERISSS